MIYSIIEIILVILSTVSAIFIFAVNRKYEKKIQELEDENERIAFKREELWGCYAMVLSDNVQLESLAYTDQLTGCLNRNALERDRETIESEENAIVIVDINGLKAINDKQGHEAGDKVIMSVANDLRRFGTVYRLGGDEFLLIIKDNAKTFVKFAEKQKQFAYGMFVRCNNIRVNLDFPIIRTYGINFSLSSAMSQADKGMYKCKKEMKRRLRKCH